MTIMTQTNNGNDNNANNANFTNNNSNKPFSKRWRQHWRKVRRAFKYRARR